MGLDDLINNAGDALEHAAGSLGRGVDQVAGTVVEQGAHALAAGLTDLGLSGAARAVSTAGNGIADHLGDMGDMGDTVPELGLGESREPTDLVHGDPAAMEDTAARLRAFATAFGDTTRGLRGLDTAHWTGAAADAFRRRYGQYPARWSAATDACAAAAAAWQDYAAVARAAQRQAADAIALHQRGTHATAEATARYQQALAAYQQALAAYQRDATAYTNATATGTGTGAGSAGPPAAPAPFPDPGVADREHAQQLLDRARQQRDVAAEHAARAISATTGLAPATPTFTQRLRDDLADAATVAGQSALHVAGGVVQGAGDLGKSLRAVSPIDPRALTHPAAYVDGLSGLAAGLVRDANDPLTAARGMLGTGWSTDPAQAAGRLVPTIVAALATDGGSAADTAAAADAAATTDAAAAAGGASLGGAGLGGAGLAGRAGAEQGLRTVEQDLAQIHVHAPGSTAGVADTPGTGPASGAGAVDTAGLSPLRQRLAGIDPEHVTPTTGPPPTEPPTTGPPPTGPASTEPAPAEPAAPAAPPRLSDDPRVRADLAHTALRHPDLARLDSLDDAPVWRRDSDRLYRADNRPIQTVFEKGFSARNIDNLNLRDYVKNNPASGFVSTTRNPGYWRTYGSGAKGFYDLDAPGGIDVNDTLGLHPHTYEQEVAMPGGIRPDRVRGLWPIQRDFRTGVPSLGEYIPNPHYRPLPSTP
jgi:tetratricopeptide (TPR) repeat protein